MLKVGVLYESKGNLSLYRVQAAQLQYHKKQTD